jgi:hypothetical protein
MESLDELDIQVLPKIPIEETIVVKEQQKIKNKKNYIYHREVENKRHDRYMANPENAEKVKAQKIACNIPTKCAYCVLILKKYGMPRHVRVCHPEVAVPPETCLNCV